MAAPGDTRPARARFAYIPAFDGIRGMAVILGPLLFHARPESVPGGPDIVPGGFLSLDLFFVLSSYLIVSIALKEWDGTGHIDLGAYAGRRVRRLFPALLLTLVILSIYLAWVNDPSLVDRWTGAIIAALTYSYNWYEIAVGVSYFEEFGTPSPVRHVWSFALEEQFYLFAPLFLIAGLRWGGRRGREILLALSVAGMFASAWWMARVHVEGEDPSRAYYGTDTRAQALFAGIAMALVLNLYGQPRTTRGRNLAALVAYPAIAWHLWAVLNLNEGDDWLFERGGFLLVAVVAGLAMFGLSQPAPWSPLHAAMNGGPLRYLGRISYGLYLYHWPIYLLVTPGRAGALFGREEITGWTLLGFHLALTFVAAVVSFHLIERPFVERRWPVSLRPITPPSMAFGGATAVSVILAGLLFAHTQRPPEVVQVLVPTGDAVAETDALGGTPAESHLDGDAAAGEQIAPTPAVRILTVGDSVMDQIGVALVDWSLAHPEAGVVAFNEAHIGCPVARYGEKRVPEGDEGPVGDLCSNWAVPVDPAQVGEYNIVSWPTVLDVFRPDVVVTFISPWEVADRRVPTVADGEWTHVGEPEWDDYLRAEYTEAYELLTRDGADLYVLEGVPVNREITPQNSPERIAALNQLVGEVVAELAADGRSVTMVPYAAWVGEVGSEQELARRRDGVHLSDEGLEEVVPWLLDEVLGLVATS